MQILFVGIEPELKPFSIFAILLFCLAVGFTEELHFRGLIIKALESKGQTTQIVVSSLLFSFAHFSNLLGGVEFLAAVRQVLFALVFAFTTACLAIAMKSILVPMIWHMAHNFISMITISPGSYVEYIGAFLQIIVFALYGIYIYRTQLRGRATNQTYQEN